MSLVKVVVTGSPSSECSGQQATHKHYYRTKHFSCVRLLQLVTATRDVLSKKKKSHINWTEKIPFLAQ